MNVMIVERPNLGHPSTKTHRETRHCQGITGEDTWETSLGAQTASLTSLFRFVARPRPR